MYRRVFIQRISRCFAAAALPLPLPADRAIRAAPARIDRRRLVARHDPTNRGIDPLGALSVGNGRFVFTADVTGLQTFPDAYRELPLATQAEWGWHSFPNPEGYRLEDAATEYDSHGRAVPYASAQDSPAGRWLRQNPHRLSLARIALRLRRRDGELATAGDVSAVDQRLDLWTGVLYSRFRIEDRAVQVVTCAHPDRDLLAVRIAAPEFPPADLAVLMAFPYGAAVHTGDPADWSRDAAHTTTLATTATEAIWQRRLDADRYRARAACFDGLQVQQTGAHVFLLRSLEPDAFGLVVEFTPEPASAPLPSVAETVAASARHWEAFWSNGGAVDLSASRDARAGELERRIVLSQYLTALQCCGTMPPQETGLTFNSWYGKAHLEMHWWHAVHFALWRRLPLFERSLAWYRRILPGARDTARWQGYAGARWPKMVGPDGRESPSSVGVFLVWQQPHPIYYAELVYRARPRRETLEQFREIVLETAAFMASYAYRDATSGHYILGPPLIPAQELHPARTTFNPTFELAYWEWGLRTAQRWRERLGLDRDPEWDRVLAGLAPLPQRDGLYTSAGSDPDTFRDPAMRRDHPALLAAFGFVPPQRVDREVMRRTLRRVLDDWQWEETWGWDYPLVAMTAARLGEPEIAVNALLMDTPKNRYLPNGHNYQRPGLSIYLPGNGGLLAAIAMMAAGWDGGGPAAVSPGFPAASWTVAWESLDPLP